MLKKSFLKSLYVEASAHQSNWKQTRCCLPALDLVFFRKKSIRVNYRETLLLAGAVVAWTDVL